MIGAKRGIKRLFGATIEQRRESMGYLFLVPWIIGLIWFFLVPLGMSFYYVFNKMDTETMAFHFVGLDMFRQLFVEDSRNLRLIVENVVGTLSNAVLIVAFSMIVAVLMHKPFRGRALCRALVALPIIVSSGALMQIFEQDMFRSSIESAAAGAGVQGFRLEDTLVTMGLSQGLVDTLSGWVANILDLIWRSGIQILLFIGGMQSVPPSLMEASSVEGASSWQSFWKITFPMISPFILLNFIYAIIDSFTVSSNPVIARISEFFKALNYSEATTMSMVYFVFVLVMVGICGGLISRWVFYIEK